MDRQGGYVIFLEVVPIGGISRIREVICGARSTREVSIAIRVKIGDGRCHGVRQGGGGRESER